MTDNLLINPDIAIYFSYQSDFDALSFDSVSGQPGYGPGDHLLSSRDHLLEDLTQFPGAERLGNNSGETEIPEGSHNRIIGVAAGDDCPDLRIYLTEFSDRLLPPPCRLRW